MKQANNAHYEALVKYESHSSYVKLLLYNQQLAQKQLRNWNLFCSKRLATKASISFTH